MSHFLCILKYSLILRIVKYVTVVCVFLGNYLMLVALHASVLLISIAFVLLVYG